MRNALAFMLCIIEGLAQGLALWVGDGYFKVWHTDCSIERIEVLVRFNNRVRQKRRHLEVKERWEKLKEERDDNGNKGK